MKIAIVLIGAIREHIQELKENIISLRECFAEHETTIIFSAWLPNEDIVLAPHDGPVGYVFSHDYNLQDLENEIKDIVDVKILLQKKPDSEHKPIGGPGFTGQRLFYMNHLIEVAKYLKDNGYSFDHLVRSRHDNLFVMNNVDKYLNQKMSIPRLYWGGAHEVSYNDHFFICPYQDFEALADLTKEQVDSYMDRAGSGENLNFLVLNDIASNRIEFIDDVDILKYVNRKFRVFK